MNFYIGNSIKEIRVDDTNVEFSDELIDFIYSLRSKVPFHMNRLYEIDPYDDIEVPKTVLPEILKICNYILGESLLLGYEDMDEGEQMLQGLAEITKKAMETGSGLVSIGD